MQKTSKSSGSKEKIKRKSRAVKMCVFDVNRTQEYLQKMQQRQQAMYSAYSLLPSVVNTLSQMQRIFATEYPHVNMREALLNSEILPGNVHC